MRHITKAACAAFAISILSFPVSANDLGVVSPGAVGSTIVGSSDVVLHLPQTGDRAQTVEAIDVTNIDLINAVPGSGQVVDLSGRDGSLRSCYANGGIAQQGQDLVYRCEFDTSDGQGPLAQQSQQSQFVSAPNADTGYDGVSSVEDPALIDCVSRGGSLIQLSNNGQFACAM